MALTIFDKSQVSSVGRVLQFVTASTTTAASSSSATYATTNLSASLTPQSATSKVFIFVMHPVRCITSGTTSGVICGIRIKRDSTVIFTQSQVAIAIFNPSIATSFIQNNNSLQYVDTPGDTSAHTYSTEFNNANAVGSVLIDNNGALPNSSSIILVEVQF